MVVDALGDSGRLVRVAPGARAPSGCRSSRSISRSFLWMGVILFLSRVISGERAAAHVLENDADRRSRSEGLAQ